MTSAPDQATRSSRPASQCFVFVRISVSRPIHKLLKCQYTASWSSLATGVQYSTPFTTGFELTQTRRRRALPSRTCENKQLTTDCRKLQGSNFLELWQTRDVELQGRTCGHRPGNDVKLHPHFHCHWLVVAFCTDVSWGRPVSVSSYTVVFIYDSW